MATDGTVDIRFYNNADAGFTDSTTFAGIAGERYFDFVSTKSYLGIHAGAYYGSDIFGGLASNYDTYLSDTDLDDVATYLRNTYA